MNVLYHPRTRVQVEQQKEDPQSPILLLGEKGCGKLTVAKDIAAAVLNISYEALSTYPYFLHIYPSPGLGIDQVREIQAFVRLKTVGSGAIRRVVVIEDAHLMTEEAQNAALKMLEEPAEDTIFMLTASSADMLRRTIVSRCFQLKVLPLEKAKIAEHISGHQASQVEKYFLLSEGRIGLLLALLESDTQHPLVKSIADAKRLVSQTTFERLASIESIEKDYESLSNLLFALGRVYRIKLEMLIQADDEKSIRQLSDRLKQIKRFEAHMRHHPNPKLLLTAIMTSI